MIRQLWPLAVGFYFCTNPAFAEKYVVHSTFDHFEFQAQGHTARFEGKSYDISAFAEALEKLNGAFAADCPKQMGKPDVTYKFGAETREIYTKIGVISNGKTCLLAGGEGLFLLPVHRDFLRAGQRDAIPLQSPLKFTFNNATLLDLRKKGATWTQNNPAQLLDWDGFDQWQDSVRDFQIRLFLQEAAAKDKPRAVLQTGSQTYEFFKINEAMWALKKPGTHWLEASDAWSRFYDLSPKMFEDRHRELIEIAENAQNDRAKRLDALDKLEANWSPNLRNLYHHILLAADEDAEFQTLAMKRLKRHPSSETSGVMVHVLETSPRADLKSSATQILRLENPRGPKYDPNGSEADKAKALEFWRTWWKKNQN